ncbi:MAG: sulfur-oxidizing protein SoxX [Paraglaciecola sp.]|jgi:sulfur-oxidizing protein SoxX
MNKSNLLLSLIFTFILQGCNPGPDSPRGFSLPSGDAVKGEKVLMKYQCLACHNLEGFDYDSFNKQFEPPVLLGGTSARVKTYADLVSSIINPSHRLAGNYPLSLTQQDGVSKMRVFNDVMTVTELVNLVAFLQPKYTVPPYEYTHYGHYEL